MLLAIADQVKRSETATHAYQWQMLTALGNLATPNGSAFGILAPSGARLAGRSAVGGEAAQDPAFSLTPKPLTNPNGEGAAQILSWVRPARATLDQLTGHGRDPAGPRRRDDHDAAGRRLATPSEATWEGVSDVVVRRLRDVAAVSGVVATDGTFAKFTRGGGETVVRDGTRLTADGRDYATVTGTDATTIVGGDEASGDGDPANRYRVFAPQTIGAARVNGTSVSWCREYPEIVFPCSGGQSEPLPARLQAEPALLQIAPLSVKLFGVAATLTRADSGQPLSDRTVTFSALGTPLCTAVTGEDGRASCPALTGALQILMSGGYTATFAGTRDLAPTTAAGAIVR